MEKKNRKGMLFSGIVIITIAIAVFLILPQTALGKSNEQAIAGENGEFGPGDAKHPENDAEGQYVLCVFSQETNQPDPYNGGHVWNIRLAISFNYGVSWTYCEWVDPDVTVNQDYPDIDVYYDHVFKTMVAVIVWQEKPISGGSWQIKARERYGISGGGTWGPTNVISQIDDTSDNIYPKVASCSIDDDSGEYPENWWNVIWQRYYSETGTYGVKLRIRSYWTGWSTINDIGIPSNSNEEYKHPAISCYCNGKAPSGYEDVHMVYEHILPTGELNAYWIEYQGGRVNWYSNIYPTPPTYGPTPVQTGSRYSVMGYPDIWAYGPASSPGEIHTVWMEGTTIKYNRNCNGGSGSWTGVQTVSNSGGVNSLRGVAIKVDNSQCSVAWTGNGEIYFNKIIKINGNWQSWSSRQNYEERWTNNDVSDNFVDVTISATYSPPITKYSHVVWQRTSSTVWYARDP